MAQLIQPFNAQQFDPTQGVGGLPIGRHPVVIDSSEVKANSKNDGGYLQLNLKVIDGPQQGTMGAYRLNLYNANQQAVEIAHRQFSAVCHVTGVYNVQDSGQLHNIPFVIEVGPQKNDPQYTEVKKVFDINGNEPGQAGAGAANAQPQGQGQGQPTNQQGGGAWGGQQGANAPANNPPAEQPANNQGGGQQPAWGGNAPAGNAPANNAPANNGGGWNQGSAPAGGAPWGGQQ